jgi:formylglycine-generating enzyme required for sulfatase activity
MKKLLLFLLMPMALLTASAQNNDYNMVIELKNGTTITLGADEVGNLTFNSETLSISGNTIEDILAILASNKTEIDELRALVNQLQDIIIKPEGTFTVNGISFKMVKVSGGTFQMGATPEQGSEIDEDELPVHSVTLSDYWIGETEVTQLLWHAVMGSNPSLCAGDSQLPVENVSWDDCQEFITRLNQLTGQSFRLPTEAEWEFAARGGNSSQGYKYAGSNTIGDVAWYYDNSCALGSSSPDYGTHPVATKSPNELGLYDMSGNVWEWCQDWYGSYSSSAQTDPVGPSSGSNRVERGGSWNNNARVCRVAFRRSSTPSIRLNYLGLRLAF